MRRPKFENGDTVRLLKEDKDTQFDRLVVGQEYTVKTAYRFGCISLVEARVGICIKNYNFKLVRKAQPGNNALQTITQTTAFIVCLLLSKFVR